jgi:hypothetical protein
MTRFEYDSASIYFEEHGSGFPLLLIAPGAMNSTIEMWANATIDPLELYQDTFWMIAMDQRNAGRFYGHRRGGPQRSLLDAATVRQRRRPTRASGRMQTRV